MLQTSRFRRISNFGVSDPELKICKTMHRALGSGFKEINDTDFSISRMSLKRVHTL